MNFAKLVVVSEWLKSWHDLCRNKTYFIASGVIDIMFFFLYGLFTSPVLDKLTEHVIIIGSLVSAQMRELPGRVRPAVIDTLFQEPVRQYTWQFLGLLGVLALTIFVLYVLLHGSNWYFASNTADKKPMHWRVFITQFARINIVWFLLFALWWVIDAVFDLRRLVIEKATGQPAPASGYLLFVVLLLILYFAITSYPLLSIRKAFSTGIKKSKVLLPAFVLVLVHFLAANMILRLVAMNRIALIIIGAFFLVALLAWARLYIMRLMRVMNGI